MRLNRGEGVKEKWWRGHQTQQLEVVCAEKGSESLELFAFWEEGIRVPKVHWDDYTSSVGGGGRYELGYFQEAFLLIPGMQVTSPFWLLMIPIIYTPSNILRSALLVLLDNWGSKTGRKKQERRSLTPESPCLLHSWVPGERKWVSLLILNQTPCNWLPYSAY